MKILHLLLIMFTVIIFLGFGLQSAHADDANSISIQNIKVQPSMIKVGDTFTVTATLVNNSTVPIILEGGTCSVKDIQASFFTVMFDNHAKIQTKNINCAGVGLGEILNPKRSSTGTSPDYTVAYIATESGTANVTVTFPYHITNQTDPTQPSIEQTVSKSLLFTIYDNDTIAKSLKLGNHPATKILSPLKQFKSGIASNDVKCEQSLELVIKAEDGSPTCVKPQTAQELVQRGWGWAMQLIDSLKPLMPNRIMGLENDTGIVTLQNQTYYFETPNYTDTAFTIPVQISFHDVVFTLFPSEFKGGLPTDFGGVATNGCGGSYFWTDAKFPDGIHELLHIFAITTMSQHCQVLPAPTNFSNHTNPQAGLTWYNGKMKLLVNTNNPKLTHMNIKVFGSYTPSSLADHFLTGSLYSTTEPIQNGNIAITVNGEVMGTTQTYPNGCFQFNNWNDSKLVDQINKSKSLGMSSMELNFQTQYLGDSDHNPANASAISYLNFYAVPLAPAQYDTEVYPSNQINVTQGDSIQFHITFKPFSKYWEVGHMKLNLQRIPCGLSYHISPVGNNDSVLVNNTASFDVVINSTSYTSSGKYWISIDQDLSGTNESNIGSNVGAFFLNVLKK